MSVRLGVDMGDPGALFVFSRTHLSTYQMDLSTGWKPAPSARPEVFAGKQNSALTISVTMRDSATGLPMDGLTLTILLKKSGGAFATITPTVTARSNGEYDIALTGAHMDTLGHAKLYITAPGGVGQPSALANTDVVVNVTAVDNYDGVHFGITALPNAAAGVTGGLPLVGTQLPLVSPGTPGGLATSDQVSNIAVTGAALNQVASGRVITTGTGSGGATNTFVLDGTTDDLTDSAGTLDFFYQFDITSISLGTSNGVCTGVTWNGYLVGVANSVKVYAFNWTSTLFEQIGTVPGTAGTIVATQEWDLTNSHILNGISRIRFANTGLTTATLKTDRILLGYTITPVSAGTIASTVWDLSRSGHQVSGTFGQAIPNAAAGVSGGLPTLDANLNVAADVKRWLASVPDALSSGKLPADVKLWLASAPNSLTSGRVEALVGAYASGQAPLQPAVAGRTLAVDASGQTTVGAYGTGATPLQPTVAGRTLGVDASGQVTVGAYGTGQNPGGQLKPNSFIDNYTYNGDGNPLTWRIRIFANKTAVDAAVAGHSDGTDSEVERYKMTATYTATALTTYKIDRDL